MEIVEEKLLPITMVSVSTVLSATVLVTIVVIIVAILAVIVSMLAVIVTMLSVIVTIFTVIAFLAVIFLVLILQVATKLDVLAAPEIAPIRWTEMGPSSAGTAEDSAFTITAATSVVLAAPLALPAWRKEQ